MKHEPPVAHLFASHPMLAPMVTERKAGVKRRGTDEALGVRQWALGKFFRTNALTRQDRPARRVADEWPIGDNRRLLPKWCESRADDVSIDVAVAAVRDFRPRRARFQARPRKWGRVSDLESAESVCLSSGLPGGLRRPNHSIFPLVLSTFPEISAEHAPPFSAASRRGRSWNSHETTARSTILLVRIVAVTPADGLAGNGQMGSIRLSFSGQRSPPHG